MVDRSSRAPQRSSSNGCTNGCTNRRSGNDGMETTACKALLHRLQALDFSIIDTVLYLNAYPDSCEALAYYQKLVAERDSLKNGMAQTCHSPVTSFENASAESWDWINGPWPWEASAN